MMSNKLYVASLGTTALGNDRSKRMELPGNVESFQVLNDWEHNRSPDSRPKSEGTPPALPQRMDRSISREVTPNLRSSCPVCGNPYQPSEGVLALACLSFSPGAVPSSPAGAGSDPGSSIILGHQECVLPRLLTLLAGFQAEDRFVRAARDIYGG